MLGKMLLICFCVFSSLILSAYLHKELLTQTPLPQKEDKVPRPGWVCPNGNSFDACGHDCKWISMKNGHPDKDREVKCTPEIAAHSPQLKRINDKVTELYNTCSQSANVIQARSPCNYFANEALVTAYGVKDFINKNGTFMSAGQIHTYLQTSAVTDASWQKVSGGDAVVQANSGRAVVASTIGHVAIVVPGGYTYSYKWKDYTPLVVSMFLDDPNRGKYPLRCMPCFSNYAFTNAPDYYVRTK
jgi:hypothetical protein